LQRKLFLNNYEEEERNYLEKNLRVKHLAIDIGANIGIYSLSLVNCLDSPKSKVIAFEPIRETYEKLILNIHENNFKESIETHCFAVGAHDEDLVFQNSHRAKNQFSSGNFHHDDQGILLFDSKDVRQSKVTVRHPRHFIQPTQEIDFIKIDVEGMEMAVLEGLSPWISKSLIRLFLIEIVYDRNGLVKSSKDVIQLMLNYGYLPFRLNSSGELSPFSKRKTLFLKSNNMNIFFMKS
jgi:FkbM family methyltransferase